jgi:hypothetical protein
VYTRLLVKDDVGSSRVWDGELGGYA